MAAARAWKTMTMKDLRAKKRDDLLQMIIDAREAEKSNASTDITGPSIWDSDPSLDHLQGILEPLF